jgi:dihydroorotase-like cyclic amidohydrolase
MHKEGVIDKNCLHSKSKATPYHGWQVKGMPVYTIIRGNIVAKDGKVVGTPIGELQYPIV